MLLYKWPCFIRIKEEFMTFSSNLFTKRQSARNEMLALSFAIKVWDIYSIFHYFNMTPILHLINWRRFNPLRSVSSLVLAMAYRLIDGKSSPAPVLDYCSLDYWEGTKLGDFFIKCNNIISKIDLKIHPGACWSYLGLNVLTTMAHFIVPISR